MYHSHVRRVHEARRRPTPPRHFGLRRAHRPGNTSPDLPWGRPTPPSVRAQRQHACGQQRQVSQVETLYPEHDFSGLYRARHRHHHHGNGVPERRRIDNDDIRSADARRLRVFTALSGRSLVDPCRVRLKRWTTPLQHRRSAPAPTGARVVADEQPRRCSRSASMYTVLALQLQDNEDTIHEARAALGH